MKKNVTVRIIPIVSKLLAPMLVFTYASFAKVNPVGSATVDDTVQVSVTVEGAISINTPTNLTLLDGAGNIIGSGDTDGDEFVTWNVISNDADGYTISWQAIETGINTSGAMESAANDTISAYGPAVAETPEVWTVGASASEWGAHLGVTALECTASGLSGSNDWGIDDSTNARWLNVDHGGPQQVCDTSAVSGSGGDDIPVYFRVEAGSSANQPTGTYTVDVTLTATTK